MKSPQLTTLYVAAFSRYQPVKIRTFVYINAMEFYLARTHTMREILLRLFGIAVILLGCGAVIGLLGVMMIYAGTLEFPRSAISIGGGVLVLILGVKVMKPSPTKRTR